MGLSATASPMRCLACMSARTASQVLSRNVANAGTPGYHRQSLTVIDTEAGNSVYARSGNIERAFNKSLQAYYTNAISDTAYSTTRAATLDRLQTFLGKPGDPTARSIRCSASCRTRFQALGASPDSYATRATASCRRRRRWPRPSTR